jgi:hypothetical protein
LTDCVLTTSFDGAGAPDFRVSSTTSADPSETIVSDGQVTEPRVGYSADDDKDTMFKFISRLFRSRHALAPKKRYALGEVFTPSQPAKLAFVPRTLQEDDLRSLLGAAGTQILIWGESGAGKSSVAFKVLKEEQRDYIVTKCDSTTDYRAILASAFAQSRETMPDKTTSHNTATMKAGTKIGGGATPVEVTAEGEWESGHANEFVPIVQTQVSAESLATILGRRKLLWVVEDLHKVSPATKTAMSDLLKVFSDTSRTSPHTAVMALGASDTASDILQAPANMPGRLATVELPPLSKDELGSILETGGKLLRVDFNPIRDQIVTSSVGVASITHGLAYEVCMALGVRETSETDVQADQAAFDTAIERYMRTRIGHMKGDFDTAMIVKKKRRYNNHAIILKALAELHEEGATHAEILAQIRKEHSEYPQGNLTQYLRELQSEERRSLIRKTSEGKFRYDQPLQYAYAVRRFDVTSLSPSLAWNRGISVSAADQLAAAELTQETLDEEDE